MKENPQKENGYTAIANEIVEALSRFNLSPYEWRVLMVIFRKTYGYQKKEDWISLSQIVSATGIHKANVSRAKAKLINRRIVIQTDNSIAFNKLHSQWRQLSEEITVIRRDTPVSIDNTPPSKQIIPPPSKQTHTKENITKENITKERREQSSLTPSMQNELFFTDETVRQKAIDFFTSKGAGANQVRAEIEKFVSYWTEPNKSGTSVAWRMKKTFDVKRRLVTWMNRSMQYNPSRLHSTPEI